MTYVVNPGHVECLESGRMVAPGDEVSNTEARRNPRLLERGALSARPERRKTKAAKPAPEPEPSEAPKAEPEKEDQK